VGLAIETMQGLGVYESTFDPWDFAAYLGVLTPAFAIDFGTRRRFALAS
jgi:hypothetical protein